jgi:hypothetical protein
MMHLLNTHLPIPRFINQVWAVDHSRIDVRVGLGLLGL